MNETILWDFDVESQTLSVSRFYNAKLYKTEKIIKSTNAFAKWLKLLSTMNINDFVQLCNLEDGLK